MCHQIFIKLLKIPKIYHNIQKMTIKRWDITLPKCFSAYWCESFLCRNRFLPSKINFEVWEYTSIVYIPTLSFFFYERKWLNRYFEGLCTFFLLRIGMIDDLGWFKDGVGIVIWWFSGYDLEYVGFKKIARNESFLRRRSRL